MRDRTRVLVVDDNADLLNTLSLILKRSGFSVDTAEDGLSAVDKFKTQAFDVTLMDIVILCVGLLIAEKLLLQTKT